MNLYKTNINLDQLTLQEEYSETMWYEEIEEYENEIGGFLANPKKSKESTTQVKPKNNKIDRSKLREQKRSYADE